MMKTNFLIKFYTSISLTTIHYDNLICFIDKYFYLIKLLSKSSTVTGSVNSYFVGQIFSHPLQSLKMFLISLNLLRNKHNDKSLLLSLLERKKNLHRETTLRSQMLEILSPTSLPPTFSSAEKKNWLFSQ